jgi:hypothetical protein
MTTVIVVAAAWGACAVALCWLFHNATQAAPKPGTYDISDREVEIRFRCIAAVESERQEWFL